MQGWERRLSSLAVRQWLRACLTGEADGWLSHAADPTLQGLLLDLELTVFKTKVRAPKCFPPEMGLSPWFHHPYNHP